MNNEFVQLDKSWGDMDVLAPMTKKDFEDKCGELKETLQAIRELEAEKNEISKRHKKAEEKMNLIAYDLSTKKIQKSLPCSWFYNFTSGKKILRARLEDLTVSDVMEDDISDSDLQMKLQFEFNQ